MTLSETIELIEKAMEGVTHPDAPKWISVAQDGNGPNGGFWTCAAATTESPRYIRADIYAALARKAEALKREIAEKDAEILKLRRLATDRTYMMKAYRDMLGPNGLEVAEMWDRKGVLRQHTDWGPASVTMTGEERAQVLLGAEAQVCHPVEFNDNNMETDRRARALLSKESAEQDGSAISTKVLVRCRALQRPTWWL